MFARVCLHVRLHRNPEEQQQFSHQRCTAIWTAAVMNDSGAQCALCGVEIISPCLL